MSCVLGCVPGAGTDEARRTDQKLSRMLKTWQREERGTVQVVLLGTGESGKSTITKQMKIIHINGFSESERKLKVQDIRKNVKDSVLTISGAMSLLNIPLKDESKQTSIDYLMEHATRQDFDYPQEFYDHALALWQDPGFQFCYNRSNEYQLIDCAKYFLDKLCLIRQDNYIPSDQDILRCRVMTNTIQRIDYKVRDGKTEVPFSVFDVGGQQGERQKWIQVFDSATAILFLLDCSSFDQTLREDPTKNRILEAAEIFEQVWNHRWLRYVDVILFINKIDLLDEKIAEGRSLESMIDSIDPHNRYYELFEDFRAFEKPKDTERKEFLEAFPHKDQPSDHVTQNGGHGRKRSRSFTVRTDVSDETVRTAVFLKRVFMRIIDLPRHDPYGRNWHSDHNCEYFYTCAIDTANIKKVLDGCKSLIIKKHLARWGLRF